MEIKDMNSINPYTNETIKQFRENTETEINDHLAASAEAAEAWRKTAFQLRKELMTGVADHLTENIDKFAKIITQEMGKTITEARSEVEKCAWVCQYYADDAEVLLQKEAVATEAYRSYVTYEPLGSILGIMPWNFPFWQVFRFAAPTLMAGNVILLKHASNAQMCAQAIVKIFEDAGFHKHVVSNLQIGSKKVGSVIEHPVVKAVTLTGSENAGIKVAEMAGRNIKKTVLELGGSNAFVVLEDADLRKAVEIGLRSRMQNAGQSCIAAKRFIVQKKILRDFIELYRTGMQAYKPGDPMDVNTKMGPLASQQQADIVSDQVERSVASGAKIVAGGSPERTLYPPTLITDAAPGMPVFDEEVFGPVAPVIAVESVEEAVAMANRTDYGLGVSLFTNDLGRAEQLIPEFHDGAVFVNAMVKSDPRLPFGGTKHSGYGRELALNGIREFVNVKTVYMDHFDSDKRKHHENDTVISMGD